MLLIYPNKVYRKTVFFDNNLKIEMSLTNLKAYFRAIVIIN